jgi:peptidoglycan/LPS O-acetylase OafA/YrhL
MVVLHHAGNAIGEGDGLGTGPSAWLGWALHGFVRQMKLGVPLFFVISGYCITASVDATRRRGSWSWSFLGRRVRRIYPPYWAAVLWFVVVVAGADAIGKPWLHDTEPVALKLVSPSQLDRWQWLGNVTLTESWRSHAYNAYRVIFTDPTRDHSPLSSELILTRIAWSLCYEEQFYFVCFLVLALAPRRMFGALAAATIASALVAAVAVDVGWGHIIEGSFPYLWHEFAVGAAVYWRLTVPGPGRSRRLVEGALAAIAVTALANGYPSAATSAAFGVALILLRDHDDRAAASRWLAPLRACGRRCYSIYLAHLPACVVVNTSLFWLGFRSFPARVGVMLPLSAAAGVAAGWAFFRLVEVHFLNPPVVRRRPDPSPAAIEAPLAGEASPEPLASS